MTAGGASGAAGRIDGRAATRSAGEAVAGWRQTTCLVGLRLRAAVRERQYLAAWVLAGGVMGIARGLRGWVHDTDRWVVTVDLGMAALALAGGVLALAVTVPAWFAEVVNGWGRGVLATAVAPRRWLVVHGLAAAFLALGLCIVLAVAVVVASEAVDLTGERGWRGGVALGLGWLKLTAMSGLALGVAVRSRGPSTAMITAAGVLLIAHLHPLVRVLAEGDGGDAVFWKMCAAGLPDLTAFDVSAEWIARGVGEGPRLSGLAGEVGLLAVWTTVAFWRASRRD